MEAIFVIIMSASGLVGFEEIPAGTCGEHVELIQPGLDSGQQAMCATETTLDILKSMGSN